MKIRNGFVSNSSSSSFIIIGKYIDPDEIDRAKKWLNYEGTLIVDHKIGNTEFGWEPNKFFDFGAKLNFCYLQILYARESDRKEKNELARVWFTMLEEVLQDDLGAKRINWQIITDYGSDDWGYIDHASSFEEGRNIDMFESKDALRRFLFSNKSFILQDNDNH